MKNNPPQEQSQDIQFAFRLAESKQLSANELAGLAKKLVETEDPVEKIRLRSAFSRGFYGE